MEKPRLYGRQDARRYNGTRGWPRAAAGLRDTAAPRRESRSDGWKLASYEVAGGLRQIVFVPAGRRNDRNPPSLQDGIRMCDTPDTLCLANFHLSLWDEAPQSKIRSREIGWRAGFRPLQRTRGWRRWNFFCARADGS
jgi:hypothetical protein